MREKYANMQLNEKLDWISAGETLEDQISRTKEIAKMDGTFATFMRMAVVQEERIAGLPMGMPDVYKPKTDMPDGVSDTTARQELRRIKNFLVNGTMQNIPAHRREINWMQLLEGLHWKEANILIHIKDQQLLNLYPNLRDILTALGTQITIIEQAETPKKKKTKKS